MNETEQKTGMLSVVNRKGEVAIAAMAAKAKAEVEARYVIALQRPRNILEARNTILDSCKRVAFAKGAIYRKPVSQTKTVDGFSIRFAEEAIKAMKNIAVDTMTIYEDEERRTVRISVTDLESNVTYGDEVSLAKTVERRNLKEGQSAISERMNSTGQKVYIVAATDDDLLNKVNAAKSKAIRNSGLRLVPQDILEEAWEQAWETMNDPKNAGDPRVETKKICDAFSSLNISPSELERYLRHSLETVSPKELNDLRGIYTAIKDEDTTWAAVMELAKPKKPAHEGPGEGDDNVNMGDKKPDPNAAKTAAGTIDAAAGKPEEKKPEVSPLVQVTELCKRDGVSEAQVHRFMVERNLAGKKTTSFADASDKSLMMVVETWAAILPQVKAVKVE